MAYKFKGVQGVMALGLLSTIVMSPHQSLWVSEKVNLIFQDLLQEGAVKKVHGKVYMSYASLMVPLRESYMLHFVIDLSLLNHFVAPKRFLKLNFAKVHLALHQDKWFLLVDF